jgi:hypothetical protein
MSPWAHICLQTTEVAPISFEPTARAFAVVATNPCRASAVLHFPSLSLQGPGTLNWENEPLSAFPAECSTALPWSAASISRHLEVSKRPFLGVLRRGRSGPLSGPCGYPGWDLGWWVSLGLGQSLPLAGGNARATLCPSASEEEPQCTGVVSESATIALAISPDRMAVWP